MCEISRIADRPGRKWGLLNGEPFGLRDNFGDVPRPASGPFAPDDRTEIGGWNKIENLSIILNDLGESVTYVLT